MILADLTRRSRLNTRTGPGEGETTDSGTTGSSHSIRNHRCIVRRGRRAWTLTGSRRGYCFIFTAGWARQVVIAGAGRRAARARSSRTAAVAATRAAPSAIKVICQPGMPPAVTAPTAGA